MAFCAPFLIVLIFLINTSFGARTGRIRARLIFIRPLNALLHEFQDHIIYIHLNSSNIQLEALQQPASITTLFSKTYIQLPSRHYMWN